MFVQVHRFAVAAGLVVKLGRECHRILAVLVVGEGDYLAKVQLCIGGCLLVVEDDSQVVVCVECERALRIALQIFLESSLGLSNLSATIYFFCSNVCECVTLAALHRAHSGGVRCKLGKLVHLAQVYVDVLEVLSGNLCLVALRVGGNDFLVCGNSLVVVACLVVYHCSLCCGFARK